MAVNEYFRTYDVTLSQINQMVTAQSAVWDHGFVKPNDTSLVNDLGTVTSILGLIFIASTPWSVALAVAGIISGLTPNTLQTLTDMVGRGDKGLASFLGSANATSYKFDVWEVEFPVIEYTDQNIRFITGNGTLKRAHYKNGSGWAIMY